ncbi:YqzE family protein [Bacillus sp. BRMEA1]|uniref:YqzE family protein n=1 Tax=Neobacillus endophyticus TaxID=2738405 RepID=UPI001565E5CC|nr:YqzE family protein [Neobacillus endophyticus]NRD80734.1 YqzE family protein [Neobacillus endophyticus]
MKTNDYVKYMTQTIVKYADQPKEERKRIRQERKEAKAAFWFRWFGILPYVFYSEVKRRRNHDGRRMIKGGFWK